MAAAFVRRPLAALVALSLAHGLLYALVTPPWQAPDEIAHFEYSHLLANHWRPLTFDDASPELEREIIASLYEFRAWDYVLLPAPGEVPGGLEQAPFFGRSRTLARFSLAYVPYALAVWPFLGQEVVVQLYVMRFVSVVIGALIAAFAFRTARLAEPSRPALAIGAGLFVIFLPQHAYILATVSDGNLAALLASATLFGLMEILLVGVTGRRLLVTGLSGALAILSKGTTYFLVPLTILVGLVVAVRWYRAARLRSVSPRGRYVRLLTLILGAVLLPALPLVLLPSLSPQVEYMVRSVITNFKQQGGYQTYLTRIVVDGSLWGAVSSAFTSYWGAFGWASVWLPARWYAFVGAACVLSGSGWVIHLWRRRLSTDSRLICSFLGLAAALPVAILLGLFVLSWNGLSAYQGRYLFASIVPAALLITRGWLALVPARRAHQVVAGLLVGLVLLDSSALLFVLLPFFYG